MSSSLAATAETVIGGGFVYINKQINVHIYQQTMKNWVSYCQNENWQWLPMKNDELKLYLKRTGSTFEKSTILAIGVTAIVMVKGI